MKTLNIVLRGGRSTGGASRRADSAEAILGCFIDEYLGASDWAVRVGPPDVRISSVIAHAGAIAPRVSFSARRSLSRGARAGCVVFRAATLIDAERQCMMRLVWRDGSASARLAHEGPRIVLAIARLAGLASDAALAARDERLLRRALDRLDLGLMVASRAGRVIFANRAARLLPGFLDRCGDSSDRRLRLPRSVVEALPKADATGSAVIGAEATGADRPAFVSRLHENGDDAPGLLVVVPTWCGPTDEKSLGVALGLTQAEARVALEIARGRSVQDAALLLHLQEDSVRTYLKRVFLKLGVARQNEFAALVARASAPIAAPGPSDESAGSAPAEPPRAACCGVSDRARAVLVARRA